MLRSGCVVWQKCHAPTVAGCARARARAGACGCPLAARVERLSAVKFDLRGSQFLCTTHFTPWQRWHDGMRALTFESFHSHIWLGSSHLRAVSWRMVPPAGIFCRSQPELI